MIDSMPRTNAIHSASQAAREYAELKNVMKQNGLLEKQPVYYTLKIVLLLCLFIGSVAFLLLVHIFWLQLLNAVFWHLSPRNLDCSATRPVTGRFFKRHGKMT